MENNLLKILNIGNYKGILLSEIGNINEQIVYAKNKKEEEKLKIKLSKLTSNYERINKEIEEKCDILIKEIFIRYIKNNDENFNFDEYCNKLYDLYINDLKIME